MTRTLDKLLSNLGGIYIIDSRLFIKPVIHYFSNFDKIVSFRLFSFTRLHTKNQILNVERNR